MSLINRSIANRAVHLRIIPAPSSLGESREVLRLLSGFGDIEYYKNLKYDELSHPNAALVIFRDKDAADQCLKRSPIRFRMGRVENGRVRDMGSESLGSAMREREGMAREDISEDAAPIARGPIGTPFGLGQTRGMSTSTPVRAESTAEFTSFFGTDEMTKDSAETNIKETSSRSTLSFPTFSASSNSKDQRIFQIQANPSRRNFRDQINTNVYHGSFAIDTKMVGHADLAAKVPTPGLSCLDWKNERGQGKPWHVVQREKAADHSGPRRRQRLGELWERGQKEGWDGAHGPT